MDGEPGATDRFSGFVSELLDGAGCKISSMMEEHATSAHQWCPLIDERLLREGRRGAYDDCAADVLPSPLQLLCVYMLTRRACLHVEHVSTSVLYRTVKQLLALGQAAGDVSLDVFRAGMLVVVYECAHGLARQAFVTLSSCVAQLHLAKLAMQTPGRESCTEEVVASLDAAVLMLDRMIPLSSILGSPPLVCPPKHPLSTHVARSIAPAIPAPPPTPHASSPRKVHIRAIVALAAGRVLAYAHALQLGRETSETYDEVDAAAAQVIKKLVDKPQPHTWLHCDAIAMAFWLAIPFVARYVVAANVW
jgi:hypothetical protein